MNLTLQKMACDAGLSVEFTDPDRFTVSDGNAVVKYLKYPGEYLVRIDGTKSAKYLADRFEGIFEVASAARKAIDIQARNAARKLLAHGYQLVPFTPGTKRPANFTYTEADFSDDHCTGVLCGDIVGIDIDISHPTIGPVVSSWCREHLGPEVSRATSLLSISTWVPFDRSKIPGLS